MRRAQMNPIESAAAAGYQLGRCNLHSTSACYHTSAEWIAWLHGWRRGQAERQRAYEAEATHQQTAFRAELAQLLAPPPRRRAVA